MSTAERPHDQSADREARVDRAISALAELLVIAYERDVEQQAIGEGRSTEAPAPEQ